MPQCDNDETKFFIEIKLASVSLRVFITKFCFAAVTKRLICVQPKWSYSLPRSEIPTTYMVVPMVIILYNNKDYSILHRNH